MEQGRENQAGKATLELPHPPTNHTPTTVDQDPPAPVCQKEHPHLQTMSKESSSSPDDEEERKISLEIKYENVVKDMQSKVN